MLYSVRIVHLKIVDKLTSVPVILLGFLFIVQERKSFDEKFVRIDTEKLCELTSAADSLQLKPLVDLTSRALARIIEGKTPEEIGDIFHLPDDLTEACKLLFLRISRSLLY